MQNTVSKTYASLFSHKETEKNNPLKCGFEVHYTQQKEALETFRKTVYNIRVGSYKSLMPWQHGVITTSNGILEIFELLKNNHGIKFILTSRFNQVGIYLFSCIKQN